MFKMKEVKYGCTYHRRDLLSLAQSAECWPTTDINCAPINPLHRPWHDATQHY